MSRRLVRCFAIVAVVSGCQPALWVKGSVRRVLSLEPVGQATVKTVCPPADSSDGEISTVTSADGTFEAHGEGTIGKKCVLEVTAPGEPKVEFRAHDYCVDEDEENCRTLEAHVQLGPHEAG